MSLIIGRTKNDESLRIVLNDSKYGVVDRKTKEITINAQFWSENGWHQIDRFQKNDFFLENMSYVANFRENGKSWKLATGPKS